MKKKPETKTSEEIKEETKKNTDAKMNEEEFDQYIDNIMSEKSEKDSSSKESADDSLKKLREDFDKLSSTVNKFITACGQKLASMPLKEQTNKESDFGDIIQKAKMYDMFVAKKRRNDEMRLNLMRQEAEIKKVYGDFDLKKLYNTEPVFKAELDRTGSVYGAYLKLLSGKLPKGEASRGFIENGAMPNLNSGSITTSPAGLPDKEFDEYIHSILGQI